MKKFMTLACALALIAGSVPALANEDLSLPDYTAGGPEQDPDQGEEQDQDQGEQEQEQEQEGLQAGEWAGQEFMVPRRPGRGRNVATCFARNRAGRTFSAQGRNVNLRALQNAAVRTCRQNSNWRNARTCQPIGCRVNR